MKRISKKIISLLMAAVMIVASVPLSVMTAFAATDANLTNVTAAIEAYELAMDGTVYTNMADAYSKYVAAQEAIDAYQYGNGTAAALETAATNLNSATTAMKANTWKAKTSNVTGASDSSFTASSLVGGDVISNVLYTYGVGDNAPYTSATTDSTQCGLQYGSVVFLYDSSDATMAVPVSMFYMRTSITGTRRVRSLRPTTSGFSMVNSWHGEGTSAGYQTSTSATGISIVDNDTSISSSNSRTTYRQSNTLYYTCTFADGEYTKTIPSVEWIFYNNNGNSATVTMTSGINNGDSVVYVVNYKAVVDKINDNKSKLAHVSSYKEGGCASLIAAMDSATAFDPNNYSYSSDTATAVSTCNTDIGNIVTAFGSAAVTEDGESYANLRTAIANRQAIYKAGNANNETYTEESWNNFTAAYDAAAKIMTDLPTTGYNNAAAAQTAADTLNAVVLELNDTRVDTAALEVAIDNAVDAENNSKYFTTDSYNASDIENVVTAAKVAVWSSVDQYKTDAGKLKDNPENEAIVATQLSNVKAAVAALKINPDATSVSAKNYSLNSAIAYAGTFTASDYSNYAAVSEAVSNANAYIATPDVFDASTPGVVSTIINEYVSYINAILTAIRELKPSFSKLSNGTIANSGSAVTTHIDSTRQSGYWTLDFKRNDNHIIFRTTHDAATFDLGGATFFWNTNRNADQHLDSINLADANATVGEQTSDTDKNSVAMTADQTKSFPGSLSATSNGTYRVSNIYVTDKKGNSEAYGKDATGANVTSLDYKYDDVLAVTDGTVPPQGCITGYSDGSNNTRTTTFTSDFTLTVVKVTPKVLSATTVPTKTTYALNTYLGMVYYYNYSPFATYYGYSHDRAAYTQTTEVVDISYLIDLINTCDGLNAANYTTTSWSNMTAALSNAKAEMTYSGMTADEILNECKTRYSNLWTEYKALEAPANNTSIKDAVNATKATFDAGSANYSADSWAVFEAAYNDAYTAYTGKYSDVNVRAYGTSEQTTIDAIATALTEAYDALESFADFTPVENAATAIANGLEADKYTTESLEAVAADLKDSTKFPYLNMTADERKTVFADSQSLINAEATNIAKLTATAAVIDPSALDAAATEAKAKFKDPDAFVGVETAIQAIRNLNIYADVEIYNGITVSGVKYANQAALDAEVTNILSSVAVQQYTITVDGVEVATVDYGTEYTVESPNGEKVDWYYAYKSNTAENSAKYYTTDYRITFIVKGNTTLTTSAAKATADTVKVTYVNSLNGKAFATDYVTKGSNATLPVAPARAYYQFDNYTLDGTVVSGTVIADKDITVVANYSRTENDSMYTITIINEDANFGERTVTAYYNELVTIDFPTAYAWCKIDEDDYDSWLSMAEGTEHVIHYGSSYSFYAHEDLHVAVYTEDQYQGELDMNVVDITKQDENGASVMARDDIVIKEGKFAMIGTYAVPSGCELVEAGMLFTTNTTADMTLENVGTDGVIRAKSSEHTVGDQFVINVRTANITGNITFAYTAYFTYKDADGVQHTVYSDTVVKNNVNVLK